MNGSCGGMLEPQTRHRSLCGGVGWPAAQRTASTLGPEMVWFCAALRASSSALRSTVSSVSSSSNVSTSPVGTDATGIEMGTSKVGSVVGWPVGAYAGGADGPGGLGPGWVPGWVPGWRAGHGGRAAAVRSRSAEWPRGHGHPEAG